jgi:heat shock protein HslJ
MMAGPEPLMEQETAFLQALQATRKISLREGRLVLEDDAGRTRLEFER